MSNNWHYKSYFICNDNRHEQLLAVFKILRNHEVRLSERPESLIVVRDTTGLEELNFNKEKEAADYLSQKGGLLQVWATLDPSVDWDYEFDIYFNAPRSFVHKPRTSLSNELMTEINIIVGDFLYRRDNDENDDRISVASLIRNLFIDICVHLDAIYGFSADEYMQEEYANCINSIDPSLLLNRTPPCLFWMNYFRTNSLSTMSLGQANLIQGRIEHVNNGALINFFDFPWEVKYEDLVAINETWSQAR